MTLLLVTGNDVKAKFELEPGIHRVQRVPPTESKGRRHTSTIAVAVMPVVSEQELNVKSSDFRIETTMGHGPGGQHRNKSETAVRVTHIETGIVGYSQNNRSQYINRQNAMKTVLAKLADLRSSTESSLQNEQRRQQIGNMGRGTRVRTYNFIDNRVTDERVEKKFRPEDVMKGNLDLLYRAWKN